MAAEMSMVSDEFLNCEQCFKAFTAAIGMLSVSITTRLGAIP